MRIWKSNLTISVLQRVFRHPRYVVGAVVVALSALSAALLLPNTQILLQVIRSGAVGWGDKVHFVLSMYGTLGSNFTLFSATLLIITVVLFGINIALLTFYIRRRQEASRGTVAHMASIGGVVSAVLGIGCAACGSVVLTSLLGLFGASGLLLLLPLHGVEFGIVGLVLLVVSIRYLIKRIEDPIICPSKY